jgi:hypothetical protein
MVNFCLPRMVNFCIFASAAWVQQQLGREPGSGVTSAARVAGRAVEMPYRVAAKRCRAGRPGRLWCGQAGLRGLGIGALLGSPVCQAVRSPTGLSGCGGWHRAVRGVRALGERAACRAGVRGKATTAAAGLVGRQARRLV